MSLLSSISSFFKPVVGIIKTGAQALLGGAGSATLSAFQGQLGSGGFVGPPAPPPLGQNLPTTAGTAGGGLLQTTGRQTTGYRLPGAPPMGIPTGAPSPGGLMQRIGAGAGQFLTGALSAGGAGGGISRMKRGKLTGNAIPTGYVERMSPSGVIYLARAKRRRGITARDLSSYRRVDRLVHRIARAHPRGRK